MDEQARSKRVTAVVAAYNEAARIGHVLRILASHPRLHEVIVVDDGSTDGTSKVAQQYPVRVVRLEPNQGKGQAMDVGVGRAAGDIIFFCDADVKGLTPAIVDEIIQPVLDGRVDMFIGMRNRKIYILRSLLTFIPLLGGERALTRQLWEAVPRQYKQRFSIEAALNFYAKYYGNGFTFTVFPGLSQTVKEKKYGTWQGVAARLGMYYDIIKAQLELEYADVPQTVRSARTALASSLASMMGLLAGAALLVAAYVGPRRFVLQVFEEAVQEDPSTPVIDTIIEVASITSVEIIMYSGIAVTTLNLFVLASQIQKTTILFKTMFSRAPVSVQQGDPYDK